ncbi:MAG: TonB-dependent receptor [Candidatus Kapaibacteriales bacterium]
MVGANIFWEGTKIGTTSKSDGSFELPRPKGVHMLVVSFSGYQKDTFHISGNRDYIEIILTKESKTDEILVECKQPDLTVSLTSITKTENITLEGLKKAACCNLSESFVANPSIDVTFTDAVTGAKQIQVLGLQGIYTQMLIENVPNLKGLSSPFGLYFIPGTWLESIQISKGASSVISGHDAITSQINIELKKPQSMEPLLANVYLDHYKRFEANLNIKLYDNQASGSSILLHSSFFNTPFDFNSDSFIDKPLTKQISLLNRWYFQSKYHEGIHALRATYEDRKAGQLDFFQNHNSNMYTSNIETQRYDFFAKNGFFFSKVDHQSIGTILAGSLHKQNSVFGVRDYNATEFNFYASFLFQSTLFGNFINYTLGLSYELDKTKLTLVDTSLSLLQSVPGLFSEIKFNFVDELILVVGARLDNHNKFGTYFVPRVFIRYTPIEYHFLRISLGRGWRISYPIAENTSVLASSRKILFDEELNPEDAYIAGINSTSLFGLFNKILTLNLEFYRTEFINQTIVDLDHNPQEIRFYNLRGKSWSNSFQIDANYELLKDFTITIAYRLNDVHTTIDNQLILKPLVSKHKGYLNLAYRLVESFRNSWKFDVTIEYNGGGRLPKTQNNPI